MSDITHVTAGDDEMANMAQRFFTKASDAIVQASRLAKVVEDLQAQVASLTARIDTVVAENEQLRNELSQVRAERDDYRNRLGVSESNHNQTKADFAAHVTQADQAFKEAQEASEKKYNDLLFQATETQRRLEDTMATLHDTNGKLDAEQKAAADFLTRLNEAEVKLEAIANIVAKPEPIAQGQTEAAPVSDPSPQVSGEPQSGGGIEEQPRGENGLFEPVPMAARDFNY